MSHTVDWFSVQTACTCTFSDWCMRCTKECSSAFPRARPGFQCRAVPARERSSPRGDGGSRDGGVERKKRIQANHTRRATKHGPSVSNGAECAFTPSCWGNQSAPDAFAVRGTKHKLFLFTRNRSSVMLVSGRPLGRLFAGPTGCGSAAQVTAAAFPNSAL